MSGSSLSTEAGGAPANPATITVLAMPILAALASALIPVMWPLR